MRQVEIVIRNIITRDIWRKEAKLRKKKQAECLNRNNATTIAIIRAKQICSRESKMQQRGENETVYRLLRQKYFGDIYGPLKI